VEIIGLVAKVFALAVDCSQHDRRPHPARRAAVVHHGRRRLEHGLGLGVGVVVVAGSVAINLLELFVAFLQAFIFTFLTTLFISMSSCCITTNTRRNMRTSAKGIRQRASAALYPMRFGLGLVATIAMLAKGRGDRGP